MPKTPSFVRPVVRLHIALRYIKPRIWRRVDVPDHLNLAELHRIIQMVMGWDNAHLHQFEIQGQYYSAPSQLENVTSNKRGKAQDVSIRDLIRQGTQRFLYEYDFGDRWVHDVIIEKISEANPGTNYPVYVGGKRKAPAEDIGGVTRYMAFLEVLKMPGHPHREYFEEWPGLDFDPDDLDEDLIRIQLEYFANNLHKHHAG